MVGPHRIITLDANSDDDSKRKIVRTGVKDNEFIRCNFCSEPGWLSVNDDPNKHRQLVHSSVLFYCDTCEDGEPGAKGFETFKEISKHVVKENGIDPTDTANICELIRIPSQPDSLKLFRCTFCPGEGFKFVGLSDETFVKHVKNKHGEKALRSRPDKLKRECRVCGREYNNDDELSKHITRRHLVKGKENRFPFGGFGPRIKKGRKDSGDDEFGRVRVSRSESVDEGPSGRRKTSTPINADVYGERNSTRRKGLLSGREPDIVTLEKLPRSEKKKFMKRDAPSRSSSLDDKRQIFGKKITKKTNRASSSSSNDKRGRAKRKIKMPPFSSNDERDRSKRKKMQSFTSNDEREISKRRKMQSFSNNDEREQQSNRKKMQSFSSDDERKQQSKRKKMTSVSNNDDRKRFRGKKTSEKRKQPSSSSSGDESERSERKRVRRSTSSTSSSSNGSQDGKITKNRMEVSWSENDIRWLELTDQFLSKISKKKSSGQNKHGNRIFDEDLNRSNTKSPSCDFCGKGGIQDMPKHLSEIHQDKTFLCILCEKHFADIEAAGDHLKHEHDRNGDVKSQVKTRLLQPPSCLLSVLCQFCSPPQRVVPSSSNTDNFMYEIYEHMEKHEDEHRGIEEDIKLATVYSCRICTGRVWKDLPSLVDHVNKSHKNVEGKAGPSFDQAPRRNESKDCEGRGGKEDRKRVGKVQSHRYSRGDEIRSPHSYRQDNSALKDRQANAGRVHGLQGESSRHRDVTDLPQSNTRAPYKSYPTKPSFQVGQFCLKKMEEIISEPTKHESGSNLFQCNKCGSKMEDRYQMKNHLQNAHRLEGALPQLLGHCILPKNLIEVRCTLCPRVWSDERDVNDKSVLRKHQNDFHKAALVSFNSCFDLKCRVCPTKFSGNCLQELTRHVENHSRDINYTKKADDTGVKREGGKMEERQKTVNTPVRSGRGGTERHGERDRSMKSFKEDKSRPSNKPNHTSPMEEHRQMIEKLMQMHVIVAGVVQDLVANAVETGEFNLEKNKTIKSKKLEELGLSSFSEPQNPQPPRLESPCRVTSTNSLSHSLTTTSNSPPSSPTLSSTSNSPSSSPRPHCSTPTSSICEQSSPFRPSPVKVDKSGIVVGNASNGELATETNALETENIAFVDLSEVAEINESSDESPKYLEEPLSATEGEILNESSLDGQIIQTMEQLELLLSSGADFKLILAPELIETEAFKIFSMNNSLGLNADCSNPIEEEKGDIRTDVTDDIVDQDNLDKAQEDCDDKEN